MQLNKANIEQLEDGLYLFTTPNCPTCEKLKGLLAEVNEPVVITDLDAYEHQDIAMKLSLMGTPCMIDYRDDKEYDRMYGAPNVNRIKTFLKGE